MKKALSKLWEKKNSKKGFTLVELIVVLVILAILAAIMVPALTGWITKAKEKQAAVNARTVYLSAQTVASETYAGLTGEAKLTDATLFGTALEVKKSDTGDSLAGQIADLAKITEDYTAVITVTDDGEVTSVVYTPADGKVKPITIGADTEDKKEEEKKDETIK